MARSPRSRASIGNTTPKKEADSDFKTPRSSHNALRRQQYKRAKRAQKVHAVKAVITAADSPVARKEALTRKGELYRTWKPRSEKKVAELERVVKSQQAQIEELRRLAQAGVVPRLEPASTPKRRNGEAEADSSPVKDQQQLMLDLVASSNAGEPGAVLEVEEVKEETAGGGDEPMDGVAVTTVATSIEKEVSYPTLASAEVEAEAGAETGELKKTVEKDSPQPTAADEVAATPIKAIEAKKQQVRDSSADTNAGTPRNIRRSPRKRTVKRRSLAGR